MTDIHFLLDLPLRSLNIYALIHSNSAAGDVKETRVMYRMALSLAVAIN